MKKHEVANIVRDVDAIQIPSGHKMTLYKGTEVIITQQLGGTFTVQTHQGILASITNEDADSLGKEKQETAADKADAKSVEEKVWAQLKTCYDPEIPHNIVDLGLIYECKLSDRDDGKKKVDVKMTLTAPGCGMGDWLKSDAQNKIMTIGEVAEATVEVTFDPPWNPSMMNPALRREMNM